MAHIVPSDDVRAVGDTRYTFREFYDRVRDKGFVLYPGKLTQLETFRVGCIGAIGPEEMRQAVNSIRDTLREIDAAMTNREALAGLAVFAKADQCPGDLPFQHYGNRALVVHDPSADDDAALRLACCWARWVVRRSLAASGDTVDLDRVGSLIDDARKALNVRSTIDRALATSANKIGEARNHLGTLVAEVEVALAAIETEIAA